MLHAVWQNEITLSYNPSSIKFTSFTHDLCKYNMNTILIK